MGVRDEKFLNYFVFIKMDQDLDKKFRLITAMHCNGPLPQVLKGCTQLSYLGGYEVNNCCKGEFLPVFFYSF